MGAAEPDLHSSTFLPKLTYIQTTKDRHFGSIDIYRTKEAPYQYIMDFKKHFLQDDERLNKYLWMINQLKDMDHKNMAKIHHSELREEKQMCVKHRLIHIFSNYYNFTLEGAIQKKKLQDSCFPQNELAYIMGSLLDLAVFLQKYGLSVGEYRSQSIFLSPEGYVKMFLLEADEENMHSCYYKVIANKALTQNYIFAPEQLQNLNNLQYSRKYDVAKADLFSIGMVMLQLMTLDKARFYYNQDKSALKIDRISFDLSSMSNRYSSRFINLLKCCLNPIPEDRYTLEEAYEELISLKKGLTSVKHCIRLHEKDLEKKRSQKENGRLTKGEHLLKGIQKKLTPSPMTSVNSSESERQLISKTALSNINILTLTRNTQTSLKQ